MWPDSNVGIATGDGLLVIDIDANGWGPLGKLVREHGALPDTPMMESGSGNAHLYFEAPPDAPSFTLADGLEVKAAGRLVVAPPSLHASGRRYQWAAGDELVPAPVWLLRKPHAAPIEDGAKIGPGGRHAAQLRIAGAMRRVGAGQAEIEAALLTFNRERCFPPKDEQTVRKLAEDILRYPPEPATTNGTGPTVEEEPEPAETEPESAKPSGRWRLIDGASFVLDAPEGVPAVWGEGQAVAWPRGEAVGIVGPQGVGKTTIEHQLLRGLLGLQDELLGMPVATIEGKVLLLALDRPAQAMRAMRRIFSEFDRDVLEERLVVCRHRLPFDLLKEPTALAEMAGDVGAAAVLLDAAKDTGLKLSTDEGGGAFTDAMQAVVEAGIEIAFTHHQRKATSENRKPKALADVYGSYWVTAGCGSVLLVWGAAGDPVVELSHLKQPAEEIGPLTIVHDQRRGVSTVDQGDQARMIDVVREQGGSVTVREAAIVFYGVAEPDRNTREKARRKLEALAEDGLLVRTDQPGQKGPVATYSEPEQ